MNASLIAQALRSADEVRTLPTLELAPPVLKQTHVLKPGQVKNRKKERNDAFPGLLRNSKPTMTVGPGSKKTTQKSSIFVGFNASNVKLGSDSESGVSDLSDKSSVINTQNMPVKPIPADDKQLTSLDFTAILGEIESAAGHNSVKTLGPKGTQGPIQVPTTSAVAKQDPVIEELRNYTVLMDKYSLHNFIIYEGVTLKNTPEFTSFKRTYAAEWGSISSIITLLEDTLLLHEVKLAIINGPKLSELASLNLSVYEKDDLYQCMSNIEQIKPSFVSIRDASNNKRDRAAVKIQALIRRKLCMKRYAMIRRRILAAIRLQCCARLFIHRCKYSTVFKKLREGNSERWANNRERLCQLWADNLTSNKTGNSASKAGDNDGTVVLNPSSKLYVVIPSISASEYLRLDMNNMHALQNTLLPVLYKLIDPDVSIVYVSPIAISNADSVYHERLLALLGISTFPKRLHFVVPELINILPLHIPLSMVLWCSTHALRRIKFHVARYSKSNIVALVTSSVTWLEKKLANYINIAYLGPDPEVAETLSSRSLSKKVFIDNMVNVPIGAHDIHNMDDLYIALSRLIAANLDVKKWVIKLNYDYNNESIVLLETSRFKIIERLKEEQNEIVASNDGNVSSWFTKPVQVEVRARIISELKKDLTNIVKIMNKKIYSSWDYYLRHLNRVGCVVEALPIESLGFVHALCFIDPVGKVQFCGGLDVITDAQTQEQGYLYPQTLAPSNSLQECLTVVGEALYKKHQIYGYVTVKFEAYWDSFQQIPKIWAKELYFGLTSSFGCIGSTALARHTGSVPYELPLSLVPARSKSEPTESTNYYLHVPYTFHSPLRQSRDDIFFKLCRIRGITFDINEKTGVIFHLVDSIVGGGISMLFIAASRKKTIDLAIHTISWILSQFGKDKDSNNEPLTYLDIQSVLLRLKKVAKRDEQSLK